MRNLRAVSRDMTNLILSERANSQDVQEEANILLREACAILAAVADPQRANDGRVAARVEALTFAHASLTTPRDKQEHQA